MRCTNCGLPLSPSRTSTNCPRCGAAAGSDQKQGATSRSQDFEEPTWGNAGGGVGTGGILQESPWHQGQVAQYSPYSAPLQSPAMGGNPGNWPGTADASLQVQREIREGMPSGLRSNLGANVAYGYPPAPGPLAGTTREQPWQRQHAGKTNHTRLGFTVAALCVITGGLLLLFVYFLAMGTSGSPSSVTGNSNTQHAATSPTSILPSPSPTSAPSSTATAFPGQQYIDNAQMASAIDSKTRKPTQLSTTFKIDQKIYVTFQLNPAGQSGAVCLLWYLNGRQVTGYNFATGQYSTPSFSYAIYGGTGAGAVEVYWASSTSCSDKQLAQRVDFTVTQ